MTWLPYVSFLKSANGPSKPLALVTWAVRTELPVPVDESVVLFRLAALTSPPPMTKMDALVGIFPLAMCDAPNAEVTTCFRSIVTP